MTSADRIAAQCSSAHFEYTPVVCRVDMRAHRSFPSFSHILIRFEQHFCHANYKKDTPKIEQVRFRKLMQRKLS